MDYQLGLNIIASVLIIFQFIREIVGEQDKRKINLSKIILVIALLSFWGSYIIQKKDSIKQEDKLTTLINQGLNDNIFISELKDKIDT